MDKAVVARWFDRFSRLDCRRHREQFAGAGDIGLAAGAREQAIVPDAVEALRQDVEQEAADELVRPSVMTRCRSGPSRR